MPPNRYANGNTPEQQAAYNRAYRAKEREQKRWLSDVAARLGIDREHLAKQDPDSVADAIRFVLQNSPGSTESTGVYLFHGDKSS